MKLLNHLGGKRNNFKRAGGNSCPFLLGEEVKSYIFDLYKKSLDEKGNEHLKLLGSVRVIDTKEDPKISPLALAFRKAPSHCLEADFYKQTLERSFERSISIESKGLNFGKTEQHRILSANDFPKGPAWESHA